MPLALSPGLASIASRRSAGCCVSVRAAPSRPAGARLWPAFRWRRYLVLRSSVSFGWAWPRRKTIFAGADVSRSCHPAAGGVGTASFSLDRSPRANPGGRSAGAAARSPSGRSIRRSRHGRSSTARRRRSLPFSKPRATQAPTTARGRSLRGDVERLGLPLRPPMCFPCRRCAPGGRFCRDGSRRAQLDTRIASNTSCRSRRIASHPGRLAEPDTGAMGEARGSAHRSGRRAPARRRLPSAPAEGASTPGSSSTDDFMFSVGLRGPVLPTTSG